MDYLERIALLEQYILEDPMDCFSKYALALEYIKHNNDKEATHLMIDLFQNHSNYLPNYYHYGKLLERAGVSDRAIEVYEKGAILAKELRDTHTLNELKGALEAIQE